MRKLALLIVLLLPLPLAAQVYKYTDEKGVIHYTDKPPAKGAKPASLPPLHTYKPLEASGSSEGGDLTAPQPVKPAAAAGSFEVRIVSPVADQTNRDASGTLQVSVAVSPELPAGYMLAYYVDGAMNGDPTPSTSATLGEVERGQHSISAAVLDPDGVEVARSAPVTVFLRQPTVKNPVGTRRPPPRPAPR